MLYFYDTSPFVPRFTCICNKNHVPEDSQSLACLFRGFGNTSTALLAVSESTDEKGW